MKLKFSIVLLASLFLISCKLTGIKGNGDLTTETREIDNFEKLDVSGHFKIEVKVGDNKNLAILAESNLLKYIKTEVRGNTLHVYSKENLKPREDLIITVTVPKLIGINCSGANDIFAEGINSEEFDIDLSGAGSINISGKANLLAIDVSGAADLVAKELITEHVKIDVSGAANASVYATNSCNAEVSGAGNILLYGDAPNIKTDISGAGSLERKEK
jgi:hypothetical protein